MDRLLYGRVHTDLAATGVIQEAYDGAKMLMASASVAMLCSALLWRSIGYIELLESELVRWTEAHQYALMEQMRGIMCQERYADLSAFERAL